MSEARRAKQRAKRNQKRLMNAADKAIGIDKNAPGIQFAAPIARGKHGRVQSRWDRTATGTYLVRGPKSKGGIFQKPFSSK